MHAYLIEAHFHVKGFRKFPINNFTTNNIYIAMHKLGVYNVHRYTKEDAAQTKHWPNRPGEALPQVIFVFYGRAVKGCGAETQRSGMFELN